MPATEGQAENRNIALPVINSEMVNSAAMLANLAIRRYAKEKQGYSVGSFSKDRIMRKRLRSVEESLEKAISKFDEIYYGNQNAAKPMTYLSDVSMKRRAITMVL
ncbi:MAG: hypothetical protein PG981_000358 [Wolbachia endosymbiont of Ctenocephalides orientis wCori]|nr:MAG: hypothetical protein PG981_000358 [Wolbachia endosymbiont of Ctenocephalides orientis wCori]